MSRFDLWHARARGVQSVLNNWLDKGFEPEIPVLPILVPNGGICIHVGASDGSHSYAMIKKANASRVFAFEPSLYSYTMLEVAIALHGFQGKIDPLRVALGDHVGEVTLTTPRKINGKMGRAFAFVGSAETRRRDIIWLPERLQRETVPMTTIDTFWPTAHQPRLDFIRADCEGAEMMVLKGAAKTIEAYKPAMLIEIHPVQLETVFDTSGQAVFDLLQGWGYRTFAKTTAWTECKSPVVTRRPWQDYACLHADRHQAQIAKLLAHV